MAKAYTRRSKAKAALADQSARSRVELQHSKRAGNLRLVSDGSTEPDIGKAAKPSMATSRGGLISSKKRLGFTTLWSQRIGSGKVSHPNSPRIRALAESVIKDNQLNIDELIVRMREGRKRAAISLKDLTDQSDRRTAEIANPNLSLVERATIVGAAPGQVLGSAAVNRVMRRIASSAKDIFGTHAAAMEYLLQSTFSGTNISAQELLASGRATTIIARLDALRYGSQG